MNSKLNCRNLVRTLRRSLLALIFLGAALVFLPDSSAAQQPVVRPAVNIDQNVLVNGCPVATAPGCKYKLKKVLESGGDFYSTPFQPYDRKTATGDGHGEGADGPRSGQRHKFNPFNKEYPYLRLNGLDSQSCFECHNSIGSSTQGYAPALMRKPFNVGGSAGFNSNAFINPMFPSVEHPDGPLTLFIRNPPEVFGSGYGQALGDEMTTELWLLKAKARQQAKTKSVQGISPASASIELVAKGVDFGKFTTTFTGQPAKIIASSASCPAAAKNPTNIGGQDGFTDNVTNVKGVPCDLVIRPFQWKGVSSSVRHFARDALDFHFSMQAFEKFGKCDCDLDGLAPELGSDPSVSIGNLSALVSFVTMMRPPVQAPLDPQAKIGFQIFTGTYKGLPVNDATKNMCATCHRASLKVVNPYVRVEWPTNPNDSEGHPINPKDPATWPITPGSCPNGKPTANSCPAETAYSNVASAGALVTPSVSSAQSPIVQKIKEALKNEPKAQGAHIEALQATGVQSLVRQITRLQPFSGFPDYMIPLTPPAGSVTNLQLPRLPANPDGTINVPLFSDLKTHNMGSCLSDPTEWQGQPIPPQGTDVQGIVTVPDEFLTRPLWGVADTGPWLHDGRARTLLEAIMMHGDSTEPLCTGSSAEPIINVFRGLSKEQQEDVVKFLLTLQLPLPAGSTGPVTAKK